MRPPPLLDVRDLRRNFGSFAAVDGVTLTVQPGEVTALIGANGAGKTTFYNLISGRLRPTGGSIFYRGRDITGTPPHSITRMGIARSFQITNIFDQLRVIENVQVALVIRQGKGTRWWRRAARDEDLRLQAGELLERLGLSGLAMARAGTLSHGDKRLVELAIVLATDPQLVLLDEPTAGMTPEETHAVVDLIARLAETGPQTFFLTEHDMDVVFGLARRVFVMHRGRLLAEGSPDEIRANPEVRNAYLGEEVY